MPDDSLANCVEKKSRENRRFAEAAITFSVLPRSVADRLSDHANEFELRVGKVGEENVGQNFAKPSRRITFKRVTERRILAGWNRRNFIDLFKFLIIAPVFIVSFLLT